MKETTDVRIVLQFDGVEKNVGLINIPQAVMDDHDIHEEYRDLIGELVIDRVVQYRTRSKLTDPDTISGVLNFIPGEIRANSIGAVIPAVYLTENDMELIRKVGEGLKLDN